jgi:hypothetical protein
MGLSSFVRDQARLARAAGGHGPAATGAAEKPADLDLACDGRALGPGFARAKFRKQILVATFDRPEAMIELGLERLLPGDSLQPHRRGSAVAPDCA